MTAKETMRLMMGFEAQKCLDSLETLGELARGLDYEDAAKKLESAQEHVEAAAAELHLQELFPEGGDE